jgi:hypothetical protein
MMEKLKVAVIYNEPSSIVSEAVQKKKIKKSSFKWA